MLVHTDLFCSVYDNKLTFIRDGILSFECFLVCLSHAAHEIFAVLRREKGVRRICLQVTDNVLDGLRFRKRDFDSGDFLESGRCEYLFHVFRIAEFLRYALRFVFLVHLDADGRFRARGEEHPEGGIGAPRLEDAFDGPERFLRGEPVKCRAGICHVEALLREREFLRRSFDIFDGEFVRFRALSGFDKHSIVDIGAGDRHRNLVFLGERQDRLGRIADAAADIQDGGIGFFAEKGNKELVEPLVLAAAPFLVFFCDCAEGLLVAVDFHKWIIAFSGWSDWALMSLESRFEHRSACGASY